MVKIDDLGYLSVGSQDAVLVSCVVDELDVSLLRSLIYYIFKMTGGWGWGCVCF